MGELCESTYSLDCISFDIPFAFQNPGSLDFGIFLRESHPVDILYLRRARLNAHPPTQILKSFGYPYFFFLEFLRSLGEFLGASPKISRR